MLILVYIAIAVAVASWLVAVVACTRLFPLRQDEISGWEMMVNGMGWFRRDTFKPAAEGMHRLFMRAFATFFAAILATIIFVTLTRL